MSVRFREVSIFSPAGIPVFPLKALIPVAGVLLLIQGIAEIIRCILCIRRATGRSACTTSKRWRPSSCTSSSISREHGETPARCRAQGDRSMTDPQIGMSMLVLFIFIIMLGFPIAFTLMAMGVGFGFYAYYTPGQDVFANRVFTLLVQKTFEVTSNDVLISVPLFLSWATSSIAPTFSTGCSTRCRSR